MSLCQSASVRTVALDDFVILMDLSTANYLLMEEVAAAMWLALTEEPNREAALARLERRFDVDRDRLLNDLERFEQDCRQRGYLTSEKPTPRQRPAAVRRRPGRSGWLTGRAWLALARTFFSLRKRGFSAVYERAIRDGADRHDRKIGATTLLARAENAFVRAENAFVLRAAPQDCLPRSLALFRFLISIGLPASHVIGVRRIPLGMHAWVESGGRVLLRDHLHQGMSIIARIDA